jgi:hypothetical protein
MSKRPIIQQKRVPNKLPFFQFSCYELQIHNGLFDRVIEPN